MKYLFDENDYRQLEYGENYVDKFVIIDPNWFKYDYREAKNQLFHAESGFGCYPDKLGGKVFGHFYDEYTHVRREDILGVATENAISDWEKTYGMSRDVFIDNGGDV